jgi:hypothetical protein
MPSPSLPPSLKTEREMMIALKKGVAEAAILSGAAAVIAEAAVAVIAEAAAAVIAEAAAAVIAEAAAVIKMIGATAEEIPETEVGVVFSDRKNFKSEVSKPLLNQLPSQFSP